MNAHRIQSIVNISSLIARYGSARSEASLSHISQRTGQLTTNPTNPRNAPGRSISGRRFGIQHQRHLRSAANSVKMSRILFSEGEDSSQLSKEVSDLVSKPENSWTLSGDGRALERSFKFKTFKTTWEFMNIVAKECKVERHHPEWSNVYNRTYIRWMTHKPLGLSSKDIRMAKFCDEQAAMLKEAGGVSNPSEVSDGECRPKDLTDRVARDAGDCCVPKKLVPAK